MRSAFHDVFPWFSSVYCISFSQQKTPWRMHPAVSTVDIFHQDDDAELSDLFYAMQAIEMLPGAHSFAEAETLVELVFAV